MKANRTLLDLFFEAQMLVRLPRTAYVLRGVAEPESVTQHGTFMPTGWETYMSYLQLGEGEQKALAGPIDLGALLSDEIVL